VGFILLFSCLCVFWVSNNGFSSNFVIGLLVQVNMQNLSISLPVISSQKERSDAIGIYMTFNMSSNWGFVKQVCIVVDF